MGGRLDLGFVQVTIVVKGEMNETIAKSYLSVINERLETEDKVIEVFLDEYGTKDVEV